MKVLLLAGEESGILYAEQIRAELLRRHPEAEIRGYGEYGFKTADLAVMGFLAVLRKLFYFLRVKRTLERAIVDWRPDVVCTVDYPGLNLKLAAFAKARGVRAVHVVCPQVWAWKKGRIPKIEAALDRLCCFFPFEPQYFRPGFAEFVGHPLAEAMRGEGADVGVGVGKVLALLPGSRIGEIERNLPVMLEVVKRLTETSHASHIQVVVPAANEQALRVISASIERGVVDHADVRVQLGGAREVLRRADAAVVASGTATLEAALDGCPTVLVYRVGAVFYYLAKHLIKGIRHIGLANIIAEKAGVEAPMPELIQADFTPAKVLAHLRPWLTDPAANAAARESLRRTMAHLASSGSAIARIVDQL